MPQLIKVTRPTKIELIKLRRRLSLATRIQKLVKDRVSILVMEFLQIAEQTERSIVAVVTFRFGLFRPVIIGQFLDYLAVFAKLIPFIGEVYPWTPEKTSAGLLEDQAF